MSKKIGGLVAVASASVLSLFLLSCGSSSSRPSGVLYVLTQGSNGYGNNVTSFAVDLNSGNLSLVNSNASTCPTAATQTNPEPCGLPLQIVLDPAGANAYVLNQGTPCVVQSNQCLTGTATISPSIYPYTVNSDGSLSAPGSVVNWANGNDTAVAMTLDAAGQFLFVIDQGTINPGVSPPPINCPPSGSSDPSYAGCPSISVFALPQSGNTLTLESGSPFYVSKIPTALSTIAFTPSGSTKAQDLLFVTNNYDLCAVSCIAPSPHNDNTVSMYFVDPSSGTLSEQQNSPYTVSAISPSSVIAVNTNSTGTSNAGGVFVYVGQGASVGAIYPFQVCTSTAVCSQQQVAGNTLVPLSTCPLQSCTVPPSSVGADPVQMVIDPTDNFLYGVSRGASQVFGFHIDNTAGTLAALTPPNQPTGSQPVSIALHPSVNNTGQFLYTSNNASDNISGFTLGTTSGSISGSFTVVAPAAPSGLAIH